MFENACISFPVSLKSFPRIQMLFPTFVCILISVAFSSDSFRGLELLTEACEIAEGPSTKRQRHDNPTTTSIPIV